MFSSSLALSTSSSSSALSLSYYQFLTFIIVISQIEKRFAVVKSEYLNSSKITLRKILHNDKNDIQNGGDYLSLVDNNNSEQRSLELLPKLFTFHTEDDDIKVEFEFKVPFVEIPVKRSGDLLKNAAKGLVNINIPAIILTGLIIVGGIGVGKLFDSIHYVDPSSTYYFGKENHHQRSSTFNFERLPFKLKYKNSKGHSSEIGLIDLVEDIENMFQTKNVDVITCVQKFVCTRARIIYDSLRLGNATSTNKIVDGVLSSKVLLGYIKNTAIMEAINIAKIGHDCDEKFKNCEWSLTNFNTLIDDYFKVLD